METRKPIHEVKVGKVRAAIWANQSPNGTYHCVTLGTLYKTGERWKTSSSVDLADISDAHQALQQVSAWFETQASSPSEQS